MSLRLLLALAAALLLTVFATQNNQFVVLRFLVYSWETSLGLVIVSSAVLGGLLVGLLGLVRQVGLRVRAREEQSRLRRAEAELVELQKQLAQREQELSRLRGELAAAKNRSSEA
ncbi:MAG TPA: lipopolysaccharide assembly protein LapA domain-containing protein [Bacillota bacterium]